MIKGEKTMSEKKTTEMNELLEEANEMSIGEEAGGAISITPSIPGAVTKAFNCGRVLTVSAECSISRTSCGLIRK